MNLFNNPLIRKIKHMTPTNRKVVFNNELVLSFLKHRGIKNLLQYISKQTGQTYTL